MSSYSYERVHIPVQYGSRETTGQWMVDPGDGREKYRLRIPIEGFHQNEVRVRVNGNQLYLYGEQIENRSQGTSKKIIEKSYNLPTDVDPSRPYITYPSPAMIQVDFPSKYRPTQPKPVEYYAQKYQNLSRVPILHSRDASPIPSRSAYQFHSIRNGPRRRPVVIRDRSVSPGLSSITEESTSDSSAGSTIFPTDFNSSAFYRSEFHPEIFTDDQHRRFIELKLDVRNSHSEDLQISINGNDLIVRNENTNFYKQITLPSNIDASSLSINHHHDHKLYITIKLLDEHSSFKYI